jgi:ATP-dependent protease ClpP protease subunit
VNKRRREIMNAMQPVVDVALARPAVATGVTARVLNAATTEVTIYGAIGGGGWDETSVSASGMKQVLDSITTPNIDLHMNSGGGDVFDGTAIHTMIARHPAVVHGSVDGIAASAASFIMMACDKITIARNAMMMIHGGMTMTQGNAQTHQRSADLLDKVSDNIADMYAVRAGGDAGEWRALMDVNMEDGTWFTGLEAVEAGLADNVSGDDDDDPDVEDRARRILSHFAGAPAYVAGERKQDEQIDESSAHEDVPEESALDPRDDQARTMLALLAERMKGHQV